MKLIISTSPQAEAVRLARALLDEKLIACANLIGSVKSLYWWKGKQEEAEETLMLMKTTDALASRVIDRLKELHPYEVPEIVLVDIAGGWPPYLRWIEESVSG